MPKPKLSSERRKVVNDVIRVFTDGNLTAVLATREHIANLSPEQQATVFVMMLIGRGDEPPGRLDDAIEYYTGTERAADYLSEKPLAKYLMNGLERFD